MYCGTRERGEVGGEKWARYPVMTRQLVESALLQVHTGVAKGPAKKGITAGIHDIHWPGLGKQPHVPWVAMSRQHLYVGRPFLFKRSEGCLGGSVMISGSWDRAAHQAFCSAGDLLLLLLLPAAPPTCALSLSL